jgi:hypothetical protein
MMTTSVQPQKATDLPASPAPEPTARQIYELQVPGSQEVALNEVLLMEEAANAQGDSGAARPLQTESLPDVYEKAGVRVPAHGFTILKVADMLSSAHLRGLSTDGKRAALLMALEANSVHLNDVLEDASRRDQALNQYEARQQKTFQDFKTWKQQQNQKIQAEIDLLIEACRSRMETNEKEVATEKARLDGWCALKREEEKRIRSASSQFVQNNQPASIAETVPVTAAQPEAAAAGTGAKAKPLATPVPVTDSPSDFGAKRLARWKR